MAAKLPQRIDQIANRALVHAGNTAQLEIAADHGQCRRQGSDGGARVAHEQVGFLLFELTPQAVNLERRAPLTNAATQHPQRVQHDAGVVGVQQIMQGGGALAQRRQQQHPVGDAFGAGQNNRAACGGEGWNI